MIAFLKESATMPPENQRARNLLLIARARLLEAEEWLRKQDEMSDKHLSEDYHRVALNETRGAIQLAIDAGRMLMKR
ncbi:MAG: hypothetical protein SGJ19_05045 [Planctomycetia bacterium]|nr:hypothetical protein [Planctomycetia bacterium]